MRRWLLWNFTADDDDANDANGAHHTHHHAKLIAANGLAMGSETWPEVNRQKNGVKKTKKTAMKIHMFHMFHIFHENFQMVGRRFFQITVYL